MQIQGEIMLEEIGRYKIEGELGRGSMAVVLKAYDPSIDRTLAIKVLRQERCEDAEYRMRFLREAKAAGLLSHPNIVTIYDIGEIDNRPYIAMELLEGEPLDEYMLSTPNRSLEESLNIAIQLAKALDYAHGKGVVHRDIKPSNIICAKDGSHITITDFGIAHIEDPGMTNHTQMGEVLGTPQYMSPEQALGKKADARSDLFSLGVILYQLFSGKKPFKGDTIASLLLEITTVDPTPVDQLVPGLPRAIRLIIDRLLKKQPEKRFKNGNELAAALIDVLHEYREKDKQGNKPRIIPIRVKWALIMAAIVSVTMILGATWLYNRQYKIMTQQVTEYGSSLVRFMATESAESILREDWIAIETFVQDAMTGQQFSYVTVVDSHNIVRGSNNGKTGQGYVNVAGNGKLFAKISDVEIRRYVASKATEMLDFEAPITFKNKEIGRIHLGMPWDPLEKLAQQTVIAMTILMVVTVFAAAFVAYMLAGATSIPIRLLQKALGEIRKGNSGYRIVEVRKDEFGQLFEEFNEMAEALQETNEHTEPPASS
jgi:eukaryotic-like serine/threonine-protein kinase